MLETLLNLSIGIFYLFLGFAFFYASIPLFFSKAKILFMDSRKFVMAALAALVYLLIMDILRQVCHGNGLVTSRTFLFSVEILFFVVLREPGRVWFFSS